MYRVPEALHRKSDYLQHHVFHMNRAETEMMRYMRRLADRDLALDRAMIPLGLLHNETELGGGNDASQLARVFDDCIPLRRKIRRWLS